LQRALGQHGSRPVPEGGDGVPLMAAGAAGGQMGFDLVLVRRLVR
jgi:hypothetical protein